MKFRLKRSHITFAHDLIMTALSYTIALYLRVGDRLFHEFVPAWQYGLLVALPVAAFCYWIFGLYRGVWRYASIPDLKQIMKAVVMTALLLVLGMVIIQQVHTIPRSLPVIFALVLLIALGGPRFIYRVIKDHGIAPTLQALGKPRIPVLLIGADNEADTFLRSLHQQPDPLYRVVGLLDDRGGKRVGMHIRGVPVLGRFDELETVLHELHANGIQPQRLVLTRPRNETEGQFVRDLLERAERHGLTIARLQSPTDLQDTRHDNQPLRPIALEDLLGRPQAVLDMPGIRNFIEGRRVLVTGAGGTIGGELSRQIAAFSPAELILLDHSEYNLYEINQDIRSIPDLPYRSILCNIRDQSRVNAIFHETKPEIVFHAAALKHVGMVEENPAEAALTNAIGARIIADAAKANGALAFVLISTDKAIRPSSIMGATKRIAEIYCQALDLLDTLPRQTRFMTVRFGNVIGSSGSVVPLFQKQLARGGPLTITHPDMKRYFMTVKEAVELVLQASSHGLKTPEERGKIFVLDMGEPVKIVDLAHQIIRLAGLHPEDIPIAFTGIQKGEKLFEEILDPDENPTLSEADRIYIATPVTMDYVQILRAMENMLEAANNGDTARILSLLETILPSLARQRNKAEAA